MTVESAEKSVFDPWLFDRLSLLEGHWRGEGQGQYPTLDPFRFEDLWTFEVEASYPHVSYRRFTELAPEGEPSHQEMGFVQVDSEGLVVWSNVQTGGRVEVLQGHFLKTQEQGFDLALESTFLGQDPRLVSTTRRFCLRGAELRYTCSMSTRTTPTPQLGIHIQAKLRRVAPIEGGSRVL